MKHKFTDRQQSLISDMKQGWKLAKLSLLRQNKTTKIRWELRRISESGFIRSQKVSADTVKSLMELKILQTYAPIEGRSEKVFFISDAQISELNKSEHRAHWVAELNCDCPNCKRYVNLLDAPDFWDGRGELEIGQRDTEYTDNMEVACPNCGHDFEVCCEY